MLAGSFRIFVIVNVFFCRFNTLSSNKEKDRLNLLSLEKRLKSEVAARETGEKLLVEEKRQRKEVEDNATVALADR